MTTETSPATWFERGLRWQIAVSDQYAPEQGGTDGDSEADQGGAAERRQGAAGRRVQEDDRAHAEEDRTALGKQGAAVARRKRTGGDSPKTRAELYEIAKQRDLPGRSKMGRDELARALGEN
jgi:hypothetical protein